MLEAKELSFTLNDKWLVQDFSYRFEPGKCYMLCGPNGAGKSSLLRLLALQQEPSSGMVFYNGHKALRRQAARYAQCRAVLSQQVDIPFPISVEEVVMMGRYPHFNVRPSAEDKNICKEVMEKLAIGQFARRNYITLSGGEKQRVQFARVLTQIWRPPVDGYRYLLLDEPISWLDIRHQFDFLEYMLHFINERTVVIAVLHDLNLVLNFADEVLLLKEGKLFAAGKPVEVLSPPHIKEVFEWESRLHIAENARLLWKK